MTQEELAQLSREELIQVILAQAEQLAAMQTAFAQLKAPAQQRQICLAHQLRDLQAVVDQSSLAFWARARQALFRYAIHLHHQRDQLPDPQFQGQVARVERLCDRLLERQGLHLAATRLQRRYRKHRQALFVFLYRSDVPPTNNASG